MKPNLGPHTGLQRLASWTSDSILALKVICSVIPNVYLGSCGCVDPGGQLGLQPFKFQPAKREQSRVKYVK